MDYTVLGYLSAVLVAGGIAAFFWPSDYGDGHAGKSVLFLLAACLSAYACENSNSYKESIRIGDLETARENENCAKPQMVAKKDDVILYEYRECCGCKPVYFSKSGTSWEECRIVRTGKTSHEECENITTPNTEH